MGWGLGVKGAGGGEVEGEGQRCRGRHQCDKRMEKNGWKVAGTIWG